MAKKKTDTRATGEFTCDSCGEDLGTAHKTPYGEFPGWRKGPVLHCEGSEIAFGCNRRGTPHHGHRLFNCPECGFHLGCTHCLSPNPLCTRCHVYLDGSHAMPHEKGKEALKLVLAVYDKRMTVKQALDRLEHFGTEAKNA